jgi:hypothetical protein
MHLPSDFSDLLEELAQGAVEFLLVGGYAVAFHGRPRATKDIDLLLAGDPENLARAARALARFGAPRSSRSPTSSRTSARRADLRTSSTPSSSSASSPDARHELGSGGS